MGVGSTFEEPTPHTVKQTGQIEHMHMEHSGQEDPKKVPGYPQDMFMEMDEMVEKPETYGLPKGWTGAMMGMMTLVRVLPPDLYNKITELQNKNRQNKEQVHQHQS